ncbi:hypothetical protein ACEPAF_5848 [Sanghuangporus sanghuang]
MATVRSAPVDDAGTTLAFIDSGPPPGNIYTTVVLVHGHSYNSKTFIRLLPLAPSYNLRIIAINRRDYTGSTQLSDADIALLFSSNTEDHKQFLRSRGLEIARFLAWVIDELKIPPAASQRDGARDGGLTLLGWSLGSITTLAFLRHLSSFSKELVDKLAPYLKISIIYDSSYATLGYPHPPWMYHPFHDTSIPASERKAAFHAWISAYFFHPYYMSQDPSSVSRTYEQLILRPETDLPTAGTNTAGADTFKLPSYANIEPEVFAAALETFPERSERAFVHSVRSETLLDQLAGGVFLRPSGSSVPELSAPSSDNGQSEQSSNSIPLPDLQVQYLFGTNSPWTSQWCSWQLEAERDLHSKTRQRALDLVRVDGGNHFLHWDDPDKFLAVLTGKPGSYEFINVR